MKFTFTILIVLLAHLTKAQENLVPNGSFEIYDTCPYFPDQIHFATGWFQANTGTSDFFNECYNGGSDNVGVPNNAIDYQYPVSGSGYGGYISSENLDDNLYYREYIECKLSTPLQKDTVYNCQYFIALGYNISQYGIFSLGWNFSSDSLYSDNFNDHRLYFNDTHIEFDTLLTDTTWIKLSKKYKANGTEKYLTIGNFSPTHGLGKLLDKQGYGTYIFIDSISIKKHISNNNLIILPNVITPNNDLINDELKFNLGTNTYVSIEVYNRWGEQIFYSSTENDFFDGHNMNGHQVNDGVYYYILTYKDSNKLIKKQSYIHILR